MKIIFLLTKETSSFAAYLCLGLLPHTLIATTGRHRIITLSGPLLYPIITTDRAGSPGRPGTPSTVHRGHHYRLKTTNNKNKNRNYHNYRYAHLICQILNSFILEALAKRTRKSTQVNASFRPAFNSYFVWPPTCVDLR